MPTTRRSLVLSGGALAMPFVLARRARAAGSGEVRIALLTPLSGQWARQGQLEKIGAEMAVEDANKAGGIAALGGAQLRLVTADTGNSVEQASSAAQRLVSQEPDLVAGIGAWLSSFTLAATEVTERAKLPWLTLSWADSITARGFHYVLATSPSSSDLMAQTLHPLLALAKKTTGKAPQTVAMISDDTAVGQANGAPLRNGGAAAFGLKLVMDEIYTPPLSDATAPVQRIRRTRPDFVVLNASNVPDGRLLLQKVNEFGLGHGRIPILTVSAAWGTPEMLKQMGADNLDGVIGVAGNWGSIKEKALLDSMCQRSGEPWMTQDTLSTYGHVMLIKDAIQRAGGTDRDKVMAALLATDTTTGPAQYFLGDRLRFQPNGRRRNAVAGVFQWKDGKPLTVSPEADAFTALSWPAHPA